MNSLEMYLLIKLDAISFCFGGLAWMFGVFGFIFGCFLWASLHPTIADSISSRMNLFLRVFVISTILCVLSAFVSALLPSTKEMCAIIIVPKIIAAASNSEQLKSMPNIVVETANTWIREMTPGNIKDGAKEIIQELKK
jgi:hypothetical protein